MIVELRMTPSRVFEIERQTGYFCHWFATAYAAMRRRQLLPQRLDCWRKWLEKYEKKRRCMLAQLGLHTLRPTDAKQKKGRMGF
jgi:hypothetical protein